MQKNLALCCLSDLKSGEMNFSLYRGCDQLRLAEWHYSLLAARDGSFSRIHATVYFKCYCMIFSHGELSKGTNWQLNFKNVNFRNISPIQNVDMAESCITPCRSPNRNLTCDKCYLLHITHFYLPKPGLQSWVSPVFSVASISTHSYDFTSSDMLCFWNSMFPTSQTCLCLNPQSDFPEGAELLACPVPVFTLTSHAGPVNSRSMEWSGWCKEPGLWVFYSHTALLLVRAWGLDIH